MVENRTLSLGLVDIHWPWSKGDMAVMTPSCTDIRTHQFSIILKVGLGLSIHFGLFIFGFNPTINHTYLFDIFM
jgi:hypothetical protein